MHNKRYFLNNKRMLNLSAFFNILFAAFIAINFTSCTNTDNDDLLVDDNDFNDKNPSGDTYNIEGNYGSGLKTAWSRKLEKTHKSRLSYTPGVWNAYYNTDIREIKNGQKIIFDIYGGNTTNYVVGKDQQSSGTSSNRYDREHTIPKSWWGAGSKDDGTYMFTDIYHVLPCDHDLNSTRSNHAFGEPTKIDFTHASGCKKGTMSVPKFGNITVFEPRDEVKGDLARVYFYFATRYEREDLSKWGNSGSNAFTYTPYPFLTDWTLKLLLKWHLNDPVDKRERDRNDAVQKEQGNRNPFVDYPELADYIWGNTTNKKFYFKDTELGYEK